MIVFSVIIPVYNVAPYLRECLDSVLAQTFADWEAICVDDGSTDGSGAILDEYADRDSRIRVFHQPNAGVSVARNKALDVAKGEWICFLDSDDQLREDFLVRLLESAREARADIAIGGVIRFGCKNGDVYVGPQSDGMFAPEDLYVDFNSLCVWAWGKIYKRALWENVRFPVGIAYSEDRYVLHRILYSYPQVPFVSGALYRYRTRDDSAYGSDWKPIIAAQRHLAYEEQFRFFTEKGYDKAKLFTLGRSFWLVGNDILRLRQAACIDWQLVGQLKEDYRKVFHGHWKWLVKTTRRDHFQHSHSCGEIKMVIDRVLLNRDKIHAARRFLTVLRYDGFRQACRKLSNKMSWGGK